MATVTIDLSEPQAAALQLKANAQGLTLEQWFQQMADAEAVSEERVRPGPLQAAANIVLDCMRGVPPEDFAGRPKDGASEHDHYLYGHAKRRA